MKQKGRHRVHVITMGCAKNLVDSEKLLAQLRLNGIEISPTVEGADVAVINTCGFIDAAKEESIDAIIGAAKRKTRGRLKKVYAMGCLTERYREDLRREIPEVDRIFGTHEIAEIVEELGGHLRKELLGERLLTTPSHTAYLKVSEGCDHPCSFCAIPLMRGRHVSRPLMDIVDEARALTAKGVHELVLIGQDTTSYGSDIKGRQELAVVLERLSELEGVQWIRLMYAYPSQFPRSVLDVMARNPKVCKYLDIPVQHASDAVLKSMRRGMTQRALTRLVNEIRDRVPGIALRTTLIVGYPAEGPAEFEELLDFVKKTRFERLGVFTYSHEENTAAFPLGDPVPAREKNRRRDLIMELQREISEEHNERLFGKRVTVLLDRQEDGLWYGRTEHDAPEIDNEVIVSADRPLNVGSFYEVEIVDSYEYDLHGKVIS